MEDKIVEQAYLELMISCQKEGCVEDFPESLQCPPCDPVEKWAEAMAKKARLEGWTSDRAGLVLCPTHSKQ